MPDFATDLAARVASTIDPVTGPGTGISAPASTPPPPPSTPAAAPPPPPAAVPPAPVSTPPSSPQYAPPAQPGVVPPPPPDGAAPAASGETPPAAPRPLFNADEPFEFPDEVPEATPGAPPRLATAPAPTEGMPGTPPAGTPAPDWDNAAAWADKMPDQIREMFLQDPRGRQIYQAYKTLRELERAPEVDENGLNVGGLGFRPSIDQIRDMHEDSSNLELMAHHFSSAHTNPVYASDWINNWFGQVGFGLGQDGKPTPGALAVAQNLLPRFNQIHPDFYRAIALPAWFNYLQERYNAIPSLATPEDRVRALNATIDIESDLTGFTPQEILQNRGIPESVWKVPDPNQPPAPPAATAPNPLSTRVQQLEQQLRERDAATQQQADHNWFNHLNGSIHENLAGDINSALKPLADYYGTDSFRYQAIFDHFQQNVVNRLGDPDANPAFRQYIIARDHSRASRNPRDTVAAAKAWRDVARSVVRELRAAYLQDAGQEIITRSNERHQTLSEGAIKTGPSSVTQTVPPGGKPQSIKEMLANPRPGESYEDVLRRITRPLIEQAA